MAVDYFHYLVVTGSPAAVKDFVHRIRASAMMALARAMTKIKDE